MANIGDLELRIFLQTAQAQKEAQDMAGTITKLNEEATKTEKALDNAGQKLDGPVSNAFKKLNQDIKLAKSEVIEFGANTKIAGDDSMTYGQKLKDLVERKQVLTAQTRITSQQFMMMSNSLGIAGLGVRNIINDIRTLDTTKQTPIELAFNIGQIGIQAVTVLPALHEVSKSLQAMGIFSGGLISTLSTLVAGIAATAGAFALMYSSVKHSGDMFDRFGKVISGQMSYWDALKQNIKDVSFGLIDLTNNAEDAAEALKKALLIGTSEDIGDARQYQKMLSEGISEEDAKLFIEMDKQERQRVQRRRENEETYRQELNKPGPKTKKTEKDKTDIYDTELSEINLQIGLFKEQHDLENLTLKNLTEQVNLYKEYYKTVLGTLAGKKDELDILLAGAETDKDKDKYTKDLLSYQSAINGIKKEILSLDEKLLTVINKELEAKSKARELDQKNINELHEREKSLLKDVHDKRIELIVNDYDKKKATIEDAYYLELNRIDDLQKKATGMVFGMEIINPDEYKKFETLRQQARERFSKDNEDLETKHWQEGIGYATQIFNILNQKPTNLFSYFAQLLQIATQIALMMNLGKAAAMMGPLGALFGSIGSIFRQGGGEVEPGRDYIVGEGGPEILRMGALGGYVFPNHAIGGAGRGGNTYIMANMDGLTFMRLNSPNYDHFKKFKFLK